MATIAVDTELAWAAGLFDGEGTIKAYVRKNKYTAITMAVSMCNEQAVRRFALAVGVGKVERLKRPTNFGRTVWRWQVCSMQSVESAFVKLLPYLCFDKIEDANKAIAARNKAIAEQPSRKKSHCKRGHDLSVTSRQKASGGRYCVECMKIWNNNYKEKNLCAL